jgi:hypothetical protein
MASPPVSPPHTIKNDSGNTYNYPDVYNIDKAGSSRTTGGSLRNRTGAATFNMSDIEQAQQEYLPRVKGQVLFYISSANTANINIATLNPSAKLRHDIVPTIKPVLQKLEKVFPVAKRKQVEYKIMISANL